MKTLNLKITAFFAAALFISAFISGCNQNNSVTGTGTGSTTSSVTISAKADDNVVNSTDVIVITEAKALINEVELEQESTEVETELHLAPFVANFNVTGGLTSLITGDLPIGRFSKIKFKLHKPEDNEVLSDPEFRTGSSGNERYSFIVKGTFNGTPFVYRSRKSASLVINLNNVVAVDGNAINFTFVFNKNLWFKNGNIIINPANSGNDDLIDDNIRGSFKNGFRDNDHDGNDDH